MEQAQVKANAASATEGTDSLNERLSALGIPYTIELVDIDRCVPIDKNAQHMTASTLDRLTANIGADGALTSVPLVRDLADDKLEVVSGNHRVLAAKRAGLDQILVLRWRGAMSNSRRRALQLSHNALVGESDKESLRLLYAEITDLADQSYSALGDDVLSIPETPSMTIVEGTGPAYETVIVLLLPHEVEQFKSALAELSAKHPNSTLVAASMDQFDDMCRQIKTLRKIGQAKSTAGAVAKMIEIVQEWLDSQAEK